MIGIHFIYRVKQSLIILDLRRKYLKEYNMRYQGGSIRP